MSVIVHKCTSATITVHIWTVIVALTFNIWLFFSLSPSPHSLFFSLVLLTLTSLSFYLWSLTLNHWSPKQATTDDLWSKPSKKQAVPPLFLPWCRDRRQISLIDANSEAHLLKLSPCHHWSSLKLCLISGFWGFDLFNSLFDQWVLGWWCMVMMAFDDGFVFFFFKITLNLKKFL